MANKYFCTVLSEMKRYLFWRCVIGELIASTLYCFFSTLMIFNLQTLIDVDQDMYQIHFLCTALAIGFLVTSVSFGFCVAHNAYIFPAVTIGQCLIPNCTSFLKSIFYFLVQFLGGVAGVAIEHAMSDRGNFGIRYPNMMVSQAKGCIYEGLFSFLFVMVVLNSRQRRNNSNQSGEALIYGLSVCSVFLIGNRYTGSVLNTSLIFGIGIVHNHWPNFIWIYWIGPLTGGLVAGFVHILFIFAPTKEELSELRNIATHCEKSKSNKEDCVQMKYSVNEYIQSYNNPAFVDLLDETKKLKEQHSKKNSTSSFA